MIHAELISSTTLSPKFDTLAIQMGCKAPSQIVQKKGSPLSDMLQPLARFSAFCSPNDDTRRVKHLMGMSHFGMLVVSNDIETADICGFPHGLVCAMQQVPCKRGITGVIMTGDGRTWMTAISNAGIASATIQEWGLTCHKQFANAGMSDVFGSPRSYNNTTDGFSGYYLTN